MTSLKLTVKRAAANLLPEKRSKGRMGQFTRSIRAGALIISASALSGCINVAAPEEPIVIELNINIRQEVIYRLAEDAADTIEENADIF